jgi:hypothetical protein
MSGSSRAERTEDRRVGGASVAVLVKSHFFNSAIEAKWRRLCRESPPDWRVLIALNCGDGPERIPEGAAHLPASAFFLCSHRSLLTLPYPTKCDPTGWRINPGNADLIPLLYMARHPEVGQVWGIEYDVHFEGAWSALFEHFAGSAADLLTTTIYRQSETPDKRLSPPFRSPSFAEYREAERIRAFLPLYRLSRDGFAAIDRAYRAGAGGHHELTWPTILHHAGLALEDIGGAGAWVRPENVDRFYFNTPGNFSLAPGTFVFRPPFGAIVGRRNTLWHPVKDEEAPNWYRLRFRSGNPLKDAIEVAKPYVNRLLIRRWLARRWNPLPAERRAESAAPPQ